MKLNNWLMLPDKRQVYCKNGTMATLRSAESIGEKSSAMVVDFEFGDLSLSQCGKPKDGDKLRRNFIPFIFQFVAPSARVLMMVVE